RIRELDGLRGVAILLVIGFHYLHVQAQPGAAPGLVQAGALFRWGWGGVDLFFVLSGFLITGILLDHRDGARYWRPFYLRRACRIVPLYFLVIALFVALAPWGRAALPWLFADARPLWSYLTFTQNLLMHDAGFGANWLGVTWSLAIEEQFYLVVPLLVRVLPRRALTAVFVVGIVAAPGLRLLVGNLGAYVFPFTRGDAILAGGLLALLVRTPGAWAWVRARAGGLAWLFVPALAAGVVLWRKNAGVGDPWLHAVFAGAALVAVALPLALPAGLLHRVLRHRVLVWWGLRSYAVYLLHQPVAGLLHGLLRGEPVPVFHGWEGSGVTLLALAVTALLAEISYRFFEGPLLAWGRRRGRWT
ncbi:acyltransferase, partial [bacterium]|nr:acyltransferase [bacterium]